MASREVGKRVFDWVKIMKTTPIAARANIAQLRSNYASVQQQLEKLAPEPETINWDHYKKSISTAGFVDKVQQSLNNYKVEYPADKLSTTINENEKQATELQKQVIAKCDARIAELKAELAAIEAEKPLDQVSVDEFLADKPEWRKEIQQEHDRHEYM